MLTFNIDSPLLQKDIEQDNIAEKQGIVIYFSKMLKFGIAFLVLGIIVISIFGLRFGKTEDPYKIHFLLFIIWDIITTLLIILPVMAKNRIIALIDSPYNTAGVEKIHNCNAYLQMPGMEKYKHYAEDVRQQGRELTNFECDEIVTYWTSQVYAK